MQRPASWLVASLLSIAACGGAEAPLHHGRLVQAIRPNELDRKPMWVYGEDDVVESFDSAGGGFRVHFTREGKHGVPALDANANGLPDFVEEVAEIYDEVRVFYEGLGFRAPLGDGSLEGDHGGDGRFDVYLLDFDFSSDGSFVADLCYEAGCVGHVVQENDFAGYRYESTTIANRILASHEYFHAVQGAYGASFDVILSEGTAVWASELFDPELDDLEGFVSGYFSQTDRSLDIPPTGPVPRFAYGSSIFFRFLEERFDAEVIRALLEEAADRPWLSALDTVLSRDFDSSFGEAFLDFAVWNLFTEAAADPSIAYREGASYPAVGRVMQELPATIERPRLYYASTRYYEVQPRGRATVVAELVAANPAELAGLHLFGVARKDGVNLGDVQLIPADGGALEVVAGEADAVVVGVVNGTIGGESRRPTICLGSREEVASCKEAFGPENPGDPEEPEEPEEPVDPEDPGQPGDPTTPVGHTKGKSHNGGCGATAGGAGTGPVVGLGLSLAALAWRRREA